MTQLVLHGYQHSIYAWIARLVLSAKGIDWDWREVDPFADPEAARRWHPFARVPVLLHGDFRLYETAAIAVYVDEAFPGPVLQPDTARERARMRQIVAIADSYAYWPFVRQVYAQRVFAPREGRFCDQTVMRQGLTAARPVLAALEGLATADPFFCGTTPSLADLHLGPMLAAFAEAPEGAALLAGRPRLSAWLRRMQALPDFRATRPW